MRLVFVSALSLPCSGSLPSTADRAAAALAERVRRRYGSPTLVVSSGCACAQHTAEPFYGLGVPREYLAWPPFVDPWRYPHDFDLRAWRHWAHVWAWRASRAYWYLDAELRLRKWEHKTVVAVTHPAIVAAGRWWLRRDKPFLAPGDAVRLTDDDLVVPESWSLSDDENATHTNAAPSVLSRVA